MKAVIMAGGIGIRLRPITYVNPKPLLPVGDISPIEYLIKYLKKSNIEEIYISVNYLKEKFNVCYEYSEKYDIPITLIEETTEMGTIGSLSLMQESLLEPFVLLNGDLFTQPLYKEMLSIFKKSEASMLIGIKEQEDASRYGVIKFDQHGNFSEITEKPVRKDWINTGVYLIDPATIHLINNNPMDIPEFVRRIMKSNGTVITFDIGGKWLDIGNLDDYEKADFLIRSWENT